MKKMIVFALAVSTALFAFGHRHGPYGGPGFRPGPYMHHHHHHGAGAFWTGVGVGFLGGALLPPPPPPVYVSAPARVWVPPVYGERPIYRAGIWVGTERYVIMPGYWRMP